ncbi:MAG TPA: HAD hydrolase family protein [Rhodanobacteraceae bacterium]|nr:HAD hydrolase family protein [Rhodanobacteraceae bacterium]
MPHDPLANVPADAIARAAKLRLVAFDVDGTLTDGGLRYGANGNETKLFHVHDGFGLKRLQAAGVEVAIISARISHAVAVRMEELDIAHVYQGQNDKRDCLTKLLAALHLEPEQAGFVGDDLPDLPALRLAGFAVAVANARPEIRDAAHWQTPHAGGAGAVRDVCDLVLAAQGHYADELARWQ